MNCGLPILQHGPKRGRLAMTLVEMLVSVAIGSVVFMVVAMLSMFAARSFAALGNYADLDRASRNALDTLSHEIRQTRGLTSYSPIALTFTDFDSNGLSYVYDPNARTLTRQKTNATTVLLKQCDYLNFDISQRNPSNNFSFYPATNLLGKLDPTLCKLVDVSWKCSRKILGAKINTESVQTAKIVIRN